MLVLPVYFASAIGFMLTLVGHGGSTPYWTLVPGALLGC
jgi:hypothetical protein